MSEYFFGIDFELSINVWLYSLAASCLVLTLAGMAVLAWGLGFLRKAEA